MSEFDETAKTLLFDAPNSYIGRSVTRPNARRLTQGRGQYVDDIVLPRMVHVAYVRSPHAHARIIGIDSKKPAALDAERALDPSEPKIHKEFDSNLCFQRIVDTGGVDAAMKSAHLVVEDTIVFGRHTGVTMEPRAILADYNRAEESMTVYHCGQSPHMMQGIIASRLALDEHRVRIV